MKRLFLAVFIISGICSGLRGDVSLNIRSAAADSDNLVVGHKTTFIVELAGLGDGQELDMLAATVLYDAALLSEAAISPGEIIPKALNDPDDFLTFSGPGTADAMFMTYGELPSEHIAAGGDFFLFEVTPLAAGSGNLRFDFVDATQFNADKPLDPIQLNPIVGPPLLFTIREIPEPTSFALVFSAFWCFICSLSNLKQRRT